MSIEIRDAVQADLDYIVQNPIDVFIKKYPEMKIRDWVKTALVDNEIIGVGGVVMYWEGVGEGWFILSKEALNYKTQIALCIKTVMMSAIKELKLHRLEVVARTDYERAIKIIEALGFEFESTRKKYLPDGGDVYQYVRIK